MNISTLLLFGTGMWGLGLETLSFNSTPSFEIAAVESEWDHNFMVSSKAILVTEVESMAPVFGYGENIPLAMASLTKMMTALIIIENHRLDELVTINKAAASTEGSSMKLKEGEILTVSDLLHGLLIRSGNDAAIALAQHHSGTVYDFASEMNQKAKELGMNNTNFNNPHGLDSDNHFSTAHDMTVLAKVFMQYPLLRNIVSTSAITVTSTDASHEHFLENTNKLLGQGFSVYGIKTGTTEAAGQCLMLFVSAPQADYFIVILGSEDRYTDAKTILFQILGEEILMD